MSTGQLVGGVAGALLSLANPGAGLLAYASIGAAVGGALLPGKGATTEGPKLSDLTLQTSTYGAVIPRVYGTIAMSGNVFWLEGNKYKETVTKVKSGGKGGGSSNSTKVRTYSATFAVGLCRGPIVGIRRIWIGSDLWYDAGSDDMGTIAASNAASLTFKLYTGSDTQLPDPRIQADIEVANAPAWRGLAYLVFYDLQLEKYGNGLPGAPVRAEVVASGVDVEYGATTRSITHRSWGAISWNGSVFCTVPMTSDVCSTSPDGVTWTEHALPTTTNHAWWDITSNGDIFVALTLGGIYSSPDGFTWTLRQSNTYYNVSVCWSGSKWLVATDSGPFYTSADGFTWTSHTAPMAGLGLGSGNYNHVIWTGQYFLTIAGFSTGDFLTSETGDSGTWVSRLHPVGNNWQNIAVLGSRICIISGNYGGTYTSDDCITWTYTNTGLGSGGAIATDGHVFYASYYGSYYTSPDGVTWTSRGTLPASGANTWDDAAWNGAVFATVNRLSTEAATIQPYRIDSSGLTLGGVVSAECLQSGLVTSGDIDVTSLTSAVRGFKVGSVGTIRSALEPLQASWPFDIVQHGYKIQFKARGGSSVATIPASDLDAHSASGQGGVQITTSREMDSQLPRRVVVTYIDKDRDYETGTQYTERTTTESFSETSIALPIVLNATEAAGKSEVLLYMHWMERFDISFSLPATYNQLEPSDLVTLTTPDGTILVRLIAVNNTSDGRVECKAKLADSSVYAPTAVGSFSAVSGTGPATVGATDSSTAEATAMASTIPRIGSSKCELLDIPLVHSTQDTPSFMASMYGKLDTWESGSLLRTDDGGANWVYVQGFDKACAIGEATSVIGSVDCRVWDKASTLSVSMLHGELYSATELAVLNGANYFAYGVNGRWEILAAQKCTLVSGTKYVLSDFLRGRFGTEWATGMHSSGDKVVLLSEDDVELISMSSSSIGAARTYRAVTTGQDTSTGSDVAFTYKGVNLECLSPIYFNASRSLFTNDWSLSWIRRSRTDGEWRDLVDVGLGESSENYSVDIFSDNTYTTVKRTVDTTTPSLAYTSAQQIADFGVIQKSIYAKAYQLSSVVGRGYPAQGAWIGISGDPYYNKVVFLQNVQGGAGWNPPRDLTGKAITWNGNSTVSSAQSPFGVSSAYFDGTGDCIESPANAAFNLGTGDFCMEAWVYIAANSTQAQDLQRSATIFAIEDGVGGQGLFYIGGSGATTGTSLDFYTVAASVGGSVTITQSAWHHLAATRESGLLRIFADGVLRGSGTLTGAIGTSVDPLRVGQRQSVSYPFPLNGYIGPHRIVKGAAVYTSNFSIPSTFLMDAAEADPYYGQVVLNLPMTGANNGTVFPDYKGHAVTVSGNAKTVTATYPLAIGSSASFDGVGDKISYTGADLALGSADCTIEFWLYPVTGGGGDAYGRILAIGSDATNGSLYIVRNNIENPMAFLVQWYTAGAYVNMLDYVSTHISNSSWHYCKLVNQGGVWSLWVDGSLYATKTPTTVNITATTVHIGSNNAANLSSNCGIGPVRITKAARPGSSVPTVAFPTF